MDVRKTCENFFDMNKNDAQSYLRDIGLKVSGNKRELNPLPLFFLIRTMKP
jgi:beta-lactam-binding protein with PASTA domain